MADFTQQDLRGSSFFQVYLQNSSMTQVDLSGSRLLNVRLAGAAVRGADLTGLELDGQGPGMTLYGVEIVPLVEAELDRRHPERAVFRATEPADLRTGWAALEAMWSATVQRAQAMPPGTLTTSVDGEWSFAQTMRHLVLATDSWLGKAIGKKEKPFHPLGMLFWEAAGEEDELGLVAADADIAFAEILQVRAGRQEMVRDYLAQISPQTLATVCGGVWGDDEPGDRDKTVLDCLRVIFNEEWQHHRYAVRDLDALDARQAG